MNGLLISLLAETPVHPGSGRTLGLVDLPVAREAATDFPVIAGSSFKGALRDKAEGRWGKDDAKVKEGFGDADNAGALLVSDARLLLLPVRSLSGTYKWLTCPLILERLERDCKRAGLDSQILGKDWCLPNDPKPGEVLTTGSGKIYLEERQFTVADEVSKGVVDALKEFIPHQGASKRLAGQLAIVCDDDFAWFARYALQIQARNVLDDNNKTSKNLWYEESLPADTLMYSLVLVRTRDGKANDHLNALHELFDKDPYLQAGGNETVGSGWFCVKLLPQKQEGQQ